MAQIVWFADNQELYVQFKAIGNRSYFSAVLDQFKAIAAMDWDDSRRMWKLQLRDFPMLVRFADNHQLRLGYGGKPTQLSLW